MGMVKGACRAADPHPGHGTARRFFKWDLETCARWTDIPRQLEGPFLSAAEHLKLIARNA